MSDATNPPCREAHRIMTGPFAGWFWCDLKPTGIVIGPESLCGLPPGCPKRLNPKTTHSHKGRKK